ncbi:hypothetical protein SDC9_156581 [bioreactor metagenome]|uniref:Uncharacterized protein n=1 Tax=bioreactor metagenome TaxID=1076179 RepID=A0A645F6Y8_9ZZZZ
MRAEHAAHVVVHRGIKPCPLRNCRGQRQVCARQRAKGVDAFAPVFVYRSAHANAETDNGLARNLVRGNQRRQSCTDDLQRLRQRQFRPAGDRLGEHQRTVQRGSGEQQFLQVDRDAEGDKALEVDVDHDLFSPGGAA